MLQPNHTHSNGSIDHSSGHHTVSKEEVIRIPIKIDQSIDFYNSDKPIEFTLEMKGVSLHPASGESRITTVKNTMPFRHKHGTIKSINAAQIIIEENLTGGAWEGNKEVTLMAEEFENFNELSNLVLGSSVGLDINNETSQVIQVYVHQ